MNVEATDDLMAAAHDVMLPSGVPVLPGLDTAAHVSVLGDATRATGSWLDVRVLDSGCVALVVGQVPEGDVAGPVTASGVNAVMWTSLLRDEDPRVAMELADEHARHVPGARGTSVVVAVIDHRRGELVYVTAGHDAPWVASRGGPSRLLPQTDGGLLGSAARRPDGTWPLEAEDLVLVCSPMDFPDGDAGDAETSELLDRARVPGDPGATCAAIARSASSRQLAGTATVVAAELRVGATSDLVLQVSAAPSEVRQARVSLEAWLDGIGAPKMDRLALVHASVELVTNAVEHAYREPAEAPGSVQVRGTYAASGHVVVDVADHGTWRPPPDELDRGRGRGLAMAAGLVDELAVDHGPNGTLARLRHRLYRPVTIDREPDVGVAAAQEPVRITQGGPGEVRLGGVLGHDDVDEVGFALLVASRGGTRSLDLDLSDVLHLSGGGIRMLADLVGPGSSAAEERGVVLHAVRGSGPQVELERAGIAHRAS